MKGKVNCAIYTRVSTDNQAEKEFNSCEAQKNKIEHFIKSQSGFRIHDLFSDEGYSGKDLQRPALQRLLGEVEKGNINCIMTYKIDRLTRSPRDFYQLIEFFNKYKVDFISVTERFDTSTPSGRLLRNIMLTFAQFERELTSERTRDKLIQRAEKGFWNGGVVPFGYKRIDKKLIIEETESKIIELIYDLYIKTGSISYIYNYLRQKGIVDKKSKSFKKTRISYILRNIIYTGKIKYKEKLYLGIHEPIITEEIFNLAQTKHNKTPNNMRKYKEYLFTGLIKCDECGSLMTPYYVSKFRNGRHKRYYYYRCTCTFKKDWLSCSTRQINANRLEDYVFDNLKRIVIDNTYIDNLIFRINHEDKKSSYPEAEKNSSRIRTGLELDTPCLQLSPDIFRRSLKNFVFAAEKTTPSVTKELVKKYIKSIQYSKEMIRVRVRYIDQSHHQEKDLKHVAGESAANTQMECAKPMDNNTIDIQINGLKYMENAGTVADEPRRSAEGRSAGGKASAAKQGSYSPSESTKVDERGALKQKELDQKANDLVRVIEMAQDDSSLKIRSFVLTNLVYGSKKWF